MCTPENLWGTLLTQLRRKFRGHLAEYEVPVSNKLITVEDMRKNVLRLLGIAAEESKSNKVVVCIDGIDHAARSDIAVSFLDTLPKTEEIPNGVCFVIVGQPSSIYQTKYPIWLTTGDNIERIEIPKLCAADIKQLVLQNVKQFEANAEGLADLIFKQTKGNNLSVVFAVEELRKQSDLISAILKLQNSGISTDIQQYYDHIWNHMKTVLLDFVRTPVYPESVVACPLLLMNGRVNIRILAKAIPIGLSETDWRMILDGLHPLVIPTDSEGEYSLFHNDFRVFLMSITQRYQARYEETALQLAEYLLNNDQGLLTYVQGIPLLCCAKKENLIPKYFTVGFVINALAEGISKIRLDQYVHMAYKAACDNHDIEGYQNVYLAVKTLHQHYRYYEYYDRDYEGRDYPELNSIDISEIRTIPFTKENTDEYEKVLSLCRKLYASGIEENVSRSLGLHDRWFGEISIVDIAGLSADSIKEGNYCKIKNSEMGLLLQNWGSTAARLKIVPSENVKTSSKVNSYAIFLWGDEYFKTSIENQQYDLAEVALKKGYVSETAFVEMLDTIYYKGVVPQFQSALPYVSSKQENISKKLLALAMNVVYDDDYLPEVTDLLQVESIKHVYDESSFTIVLYGFLIGRIHRKDQDETLLLRIAESCDGIDTSESTKKEVICLARTACLLGKYLNSSIPISSYFEGYVEWFLTAKLLRPFDYSKANRFLLYTLLNSPVGERFATCDWFIAALRINLLNINQIGMYYKADILEYLQRFDRLDVVKEYIFELYGEDCSKISLADDRKSVHQQFCPYGNLVAPNMMSQFSQALKWDVVGYMDYKEYAMHAPADLFKIISETHPESWWDLGNAILQQSEIANLWGNHAYHDIREMIIEAAAKCGLDDYWKLRFLDDSFQKNPDDIYHAIFPFINKADDLSDLEALWILSCGIHSWYTQSGRIGSQCVFEACNRRAKEISVDFVGVVEQITPQWLTIIHHESNHESDKDIYSLHHEENITNLRARYSVLSDDEVIDSIGLVNKKSDPVDHYVAILDRIQSMKQCKENAIDKVLNAFSIYISLREWTYSGLEPLISLLLEIAGDKAFWTFACCIKNQLSDYDYQTSSRNMQLLIKIWSYSRSSIQPLLKDEIMTQRLWVTGNDHISVSVETETQTPKFSKPGTIQELSLDIILEQIESQNARKLESAIFAMHLLGREFPQMMDILSDSWENLSQIQQENILLVAARWASEGICTKKLVYRLKIVYRDSADLYTKYYVHSILLSLSDADVLPQKISYDAAPVSYTLPKEGAEDSESYYENFLSLIASYGNQEVANAVRRAICENPDLVQYCNDKFACTGDSNIPVVSHIPYEILYGEEKRGKWDKIPMITRKSRLLAPEDPFILTEMPEVVYDEKWFPDISPSYDEPKKMELSREQLSSIVRYGIVDENILLAASLWYPWGHEEGIIYTEISKMANDIELLYHGRDEKMDWSLGNFGLLANEGVLNETKRTVMGFGGRSLFIKIGGCSKIPFGNAQIIPASIWRTALNCSPKSDNPFIWTDQYGKEMMWFERIISPIREAMHEAYIRQPILFRWVCDKQWLDIFLKQHDLDLYQLRTVESYIR